MPRPQAAAQGAAMTPHRRRLGLRIRPPFGALLVAFLATAAPGGAQALERLSYEVASREAHLRAAVERASALRAAEREGRTSPRELVAAALLDYRRITEALYAEGHYSVVVSIQIDGREAADIPLTAPLARIDTIAVRVDPGPPFRFGASTLAPLPPGHGLPEAIAPGRPARSGAVREAVREAVEAWREAGHAKARPARDRVLADHAARRLDVTVEIEPGPRVRFGRLRQMTPSAVRSERIEAIAGLPEGEVFSPATARRVADRLRRSGAFATVALGEAETLSPGDRMDMLLSVVDERPRRLGFGAELSSFEGLELSGYWLHRNLFGGAERLRLDGRLGGIGGQSGGLDQSLTARLDVPAVYGPDTRGFVHAGGERREEPDFTSLGVSVGAGLGRDFTENLSAEAGIALSWTRATDALGTRSYPMAMLPAQLTWDGRDKRLDATRGHFLALGAMPFITLDDGTAGLRATLDARGYQRLGDEDGATVLAGRLQAGTLAGVALADARPDLLFHSGGGGTVRGQPYQSLGVDLGGGATTGGLSFLALSLEARVPLGERFGAVAFVDAGHVGSTALPGSSGNWHAGAGIGLRYHTAFAPIRLDIAAPVAGTTGQGLQIYLGIGQSF
jgi:translocation and assembly module TamA